MQNFALSKLIAFSGACAIVLCASPLLAQGTSQRLGIDVTTIQSLQADNLLAGLESPDPQAMVTGVLDSLTPTKHTLRREGAVVGGILFGGLGFLVSQMDDPDSGGHVSTIGLTLGGVALGALTGALVGNFIAHADSTEAPQPPPR